MKRALIVSVDPITGTSKKTGEPYTFCNVVAQPLTQSDKTIGPKFEFYTLFDEALADDLKTRLREAIKSGSASVGAELYTHYNNGREQIDYINYPA